MGIEINNCGLSAQTFHALGSEIVKLSSLCLGSSDLDWRGSYYGELDTRVRSTANIPRQLTTDDLWRYGRRVGIQRVLTSKSVLYHYYSRWLNETYSSSYWGSRDCDTEHFLPGLVKSSSFHFVGTYSSFLHEASCGFPDTNYSLPVSSRRRLEESYISSGADSLLQKAALFHDLGQLQLFTTNYDRVINSLDSSSPWKSADRAEILIDSLRSKVTDFRAAIDSVWSLTKYFVDGWHRIVLDHPELDQRIVGPASATTRNPLFSLTSYVARVVSKAQLLVDKLTKRISRLVKLRICFIAPQEQAPISRSVIERRFFCIHGFHPPDLELPQNIFAFVFTGYVPGLLST